MTTGRYADQGLMMKQGITTDIDWKYIGASLARESDNEQIDFFKSFVKECLSWGTAYQVEQQLCFINRKLTSDEIDTLAMITYKEPE